MEVSTADPTDQPCPPQELYTFNPQFTDENAAFMIISEHSYVMLLEKYFRTFTSQKLAARRPKPR